MHISSKAFIESGVLLGDNVRIYGNTKICKNVIIEDNVTIGYPTLDEIKNSKDFTKYKNTNEYLDFLSTNKTTISSGSHIKACTTIHGGVVIGENFDCGQNVVIRDNSIIGKNTFVYPNVLIGCSVIIGNYCRIAGTLCNRTMIGNFTSMLGHTVHEYLIGIPGRIEESPNIGIGVVIGRESAIIGGLVIGDFTILATNAVLNKDLPECVLAAGNPARISRKLTDLEIEPIKNYIKEKSQNEITWKNKGEFE